MVLEGKIIYFKNDVHSQLSSKFTKLYEYRSGIFTKEEFPFQRIFNRMLDGGSFIDVNLLVKSDPPVQNAPVLSLIILDYDQYIKNANTISGNNAEQFFCSNASNSARTAGFYEEILGNGTKESIVYDVNKSNLFYLYLVKCPSPINSVVINGDIQFVNPYGYIPGERVGILFFVAFLSSIYVITAAVWTVKCIFQRRYFGSIHLAITIVLVMCILECVADFIDLIYYNNHGYHTFFFLLSAISTTLIRKVVTRVMVLLICLGYGSIKGRLSKPVWIYILSYAILYFIFTSINDILHLLSLDSKISNFWSSLTFVPVALMDAIFYAWVFYSLSVTLVELSKKNQIEKIELFRQIMYALVFYVVVTIFLLLSAAFYGFFSLFGRYWYLEWVYDAAFQSLFFIVFCRIMFLMRPSQRSYIFLNSMQLSSSDFDESYNDLLEDDSDLDTGGDIHNIILGDEDDMDLELESYEEQASSRASSSKQRSSDNNAQRQQQQQQQTSSGDTENGSKETEEIVVL